MKDEPEAEPPLDEEMDAALRDAYAFAPAAAEEAAARFRVPAPRAPRWPWLLVPVAAAAGILIGLSIAGERAESRALRVNFPPPDHGLSHTIVGFVANCTAPLTSVTGKPLRAGQPVFEDHGGVRAIFGARGSIILTDGSEVRLDREASLFLGAGGRTMELNGGRIWAHVTPGDPFVIHAGDARVTVLGTELSVNRGRESTGVQLFSGSARVQTAGNARDLAPGQELQVVGGYPTEPRRIWSEAVATGWMLDLVAHSGSHDRELADHLDRMLEDMGHTKAVMIDEEKLVTELGGSCRVPLARYLVSESARGDTEARRKAARVLGRIADPSVAPDLARALRDPDAEVRVSAATALSRVSEGRVCTKPEEFRGACDDGAAKAVDRWIEAGSAAKEPPK